MRLYPARRQDLVSPDALEATAHVASLLPQPGAALRATRSPLIRFG